LTLTRPEMHLHPCGTNSDAECKQPSCSSRTWTLLRLSWCGSCRKNFGWRYCWFFI
jgi:hypothetical protein